MLSMNHATLREYLTDVAVKHPQIPTVILSEPGVGKSQAVLEAMKFLGYSVVDIRGAQKQPCDLIMPWPDAKKGTLRCLVASWLKNVAPKTCIFLDEFLNSDTDVQKVFLQLFRDRCCGEGDDMVRLPEDTLLVAASNRLEDRAGANKAITSLASRAMFVGLSITTKEWLDGYAIPRGLHSSVVSFHQWKDSEGAPCLLVFDPKDPTKTSYPCPRTWEYASEMLSDLSPRTRDASLTGLLGTEVAAAFCGFLEISEGRPDPQEILKNPKKAPIPETMQVLYSTIGELIELCRIKEELSKAAQKGEPKAVAEKAERAKRAVSVAQYFLRFEGEKEIGDFTAFALPQLIKANGTLLGQKDVMDWWANNKKDIQG